MPEILLKAAIGIVPVQIFDFVAFHLVLVGLECGVVLRQALVAALGRKMLRFLAPQIEIRRLQAKGPVGVLRAGNAIRKMRTSASVIE